MLVDSSVWVAFLRGEDSTEVRLLTSALEDKAPVWIAPPVLQEVLQGADRPHRFTRWERILGELPMIVQRDAARAARDAAHLYARCRWAGVTPRSANDCLIAVLAMEASLPILHQDRDFPAIAKIEPRLALIDAEERVVLRHPKP